MYFTGPGDADSVDFRQKPSVYGVQRNLLIQLAFNELRNAKQVMSRITKEQGSSTISYRF